MEHYIIDGNNLIGKVSQLSTIQKKDKQLSREKAAFMIDNFFSRKHWKGTLHFDGFENGAIKCSSLKIVYSGKGEADDLIKEEIERSKNPVKLVVVSSDRSVMEFAKVCGCRHLSASEFEKLLTEKEKVDEEQEKQSQINNDEIKRLFGG